jgi:hypothetical protein
LDGIAHYQCLAVNYILSNKVKFEEDLMKAEIEILRVRESQLEIG